MTPLIRSAAAAALAALALALLAGCETNPPRTGAEDSSGSGVTVYGTVDGGIGRSRR